MRYFDPGRANPALGFGGAADFPAFYHREAAKKNDKLPADGAGGFFRLSPTPFFVAMAVWPSSPGIPENGTLSGPSDGLLSVWSGSYLAELT
jgi:hypothetical protein